MLVLIGMIVVVLLLGSLAATLAVYGRLGRIKHHFRGRVDRMQTELLIRTLLRDPRYSDPRHLCRFEARVYSQHGEDGILSEILRRIGATSRRFVEVGVGDGLENNTVYRLSQGWCGHWFEAGAANVEKVTACFDLERARNRLRVVHARLTAENAAEAMRQHDVPIDLDLLSLDIDRNTSYLWRALAHLSPRVVVIEYNASIPRDDEWEIVYEADAEWDKSFYFGASLKTLEVLGNSIGYTLAACDLSGSNAFFVRSDLVDDQFAGPFTAAALYEPPRYWLVGDRGHATRYGRARTFGDGQATP